MIYNASDITLKDTAFELLNPYLQKGYKVYMDIYYNSVCIAKQQQSSGVYGTITQNSYQLTSKITRRH
jgi:hypothetical protein